MLSKECGNLRNTFGINVVLEALLSCYFLLAALYSSHKAIATGNRKISLFYNLAYVLGYVLLMGVICKLGSSLQQEVICKFLCITLKIIYDSYSKVPFDDL